jgi:PHD/YefM family antitoxin component YafN of YafNO toxin-antitoxin module
MINSNPMNTLNAVDLKRRGIVAIEEALAFGPVHIYKDNRPAAVVLLESEYQALLHKKSDLQNVDTIRWIMDLKPATSSRSKEDIDRQITEEESSWE